MCRLFRRCRFLQNPYLVAEEAGDDQDEEYLEWILICKRTEQIFAI